MFLPAWWGSRRRRKNRRVHRLVEGRLTIVVEGKTTALRPVDAITLLARPSGCSREKSIFAKDRGRRQDSRRRLVVDGSASRCAKTHSDIKRLSYLFLKTATESRVLACAAQQSEMSAELGPLGLARPRQTDQKRQTLRRPTSARRMHPMMYPMS